MNDKAIAVLHENLANLEKSIFWLNRSFASCSSIGVKQEYSEEEFDHFENLTSRYARTTDMLIGKILRSIDTVELMEPGSLIDSANRAEKRGIVDSVSQLRELKELRNEIVHEYETAELTLLFEAVLKGTPLVLATAQKITDYCSKYTKA